MSSSLAPTDRDEDVAAQDRGKIDLAGLDPGELAAAVTPLFLIESRFQREALAELERRAWLWHASKK